MQCLYPTATPCRSEPSFSHHIIIGWESGSAEKSEECRRQSGDLCVVSDTAKWDNSQHQSAMVHRSARRSPKLGNTNQCHTQNGSFYLRGDYFDRKFKPYCKNPFVSFGCFCILKVRIGLFPLKVCFYLYFIYPSMFSSEKGVKIFKIL